MCDNFTTSTVMSDTNGITMDKVLSLLGNLPRVPLFFVCEPDKQPYQILPHILLEGIRAKRFPPKTSFITIGDAVVTLYKGEEAPDGKAT